MGDPVVPQVLDLLRSRPAQPGGGRLLCIDGPAGSGKTTLAEGISDAFPGSSLVIHMDDLYLGWSGLDATLGPRVAEQIAEPFAAGRTGSYRRFDWERNELAEQHDVPPLDLLVLEGVGSGARAIAPHRTALVWVSAPDDLRISRGMTRDRLLYERDDVVWEAQEQQRHWARFVADETRHFLASGLPAAADLMVDGTRTIS
ncbi:MAG TPA: 4-amino-4-deoxy-L-arabinose transferase [Nocardioides sp.]